jgi:sugar O-acyltransferase (sialic acid O-acetyltransferase NeuD family)
MRDVILLGLSKSSVAVTLDIAIETWGESRFIFYPNIELNFDLLLPIKHYNYSIKNLGLGPSSEDKVMFSTPGPKNRLAIYKDFLNSHNIHQKCYESLIHPTAYIASSSVIGLGVLVEPNVIVSSQSIIGFGVFVKRGVSVGHHNVIGDFVDLNPGVVLSGNIKIGSGVTLGSGVIVRDNVSIGENTIIGMGSVVTKDIPANSIAYGNPCKVIRAI